MKTRLVNSLAKFISQHSVTILVVMFAVTLLMIPGLNRITIARGFDTDLFPSFNELVTSVKAVRKTFGANIRQIIVSIETQGKKKITDPHVLNLIADVTLSLQKVPLIRSESLMSLASVHDLVSTSDGFKTEKLLEQIPTTASQVKALESKITKHPFIFGRLVSKDLKSTVIIATSYDNADLADIHNKVSEALAPYMKLVPETQVTLLGDPEINYQIFTGIENDVFIFILIGIAMILLSFYAMFGSWHGVVLPLVGIAMGIIWTMGLIGYYGEPITILSATIPVVLVIMGSEYALHVFHSLSHETNENQFSEALAKVIKTIFFPLFMATVMSFIGGITLITFQIYPIQHFGIFTAIGSVIAMVISMLVVPCLYKVLHKPVESIESTVTHGLGAASQAASTTLHHTINIVPVAGPVAEAVAHSVKESITGGMRSGWIGFWDGFKKGNITDIFLRSISKVVTEHPYFVLVGTFLLLIPAIQSARNLDFGFDNVSILPKKSEIRKATYRLDKAFGGTQKFDILIDSKKPNGLVEAGVLEKVEEFEKKAVQIKGVTYGFSINNLLKTMNSLLQPGEQSVLPKSQEARSQYLLLLSMSQTGIPLSTLVTSNYQKMKVTFNLLVHDTREADDIYKNLQGLAKDIFQDSAQVLVGGDLVYSIAMTRYLVWGKIQNILSSILTMFLIIVVVYRSITKGLLTCLPLPIGCILNFGLMAALDIRLDFVTAIITSFANGLGVDFAIHFIAGVKDKYRHGRHIKKAIEEALVGPGRVLVYGAVCNVLGFSALYFSSFSVIHVFATLMCFNMMVLLLGAIIVIPAVIMISPPEFITHHRKTHQIKEERWSVLMKVGFCSVLIAVLTWGIFALDSKAESKGKDLTASQIIDQSIATIYSTSEEANYVMKLVGREGEETIRKMKVWFKRDGEFQARLLIKFVEPADIRGTGLLSIVESGKSTDQWLYLPVLKKTRRIKGGNQDESFLGSDFTISDLSVDKGDRFDFVLNSTKACGDQQCYILTGTPKSDADKSNALYSKKVVEIRKDNFMIIKTEFYNQAGQLEKVMTLDKIHKEGGTHWMADRLEMKNLINNHSSIIEIEKRNLTTPPQSTFTQSFLERN
jgi:predicted RND superfamily exporter protein/outer membrane lipoprotein-sorting protein